MDRPDSLLRMMLLLLLVATPLRAQAFGVIVWDFSNPIASVPRWDAEPRTFAARDRSLVGGLTYSLQGGSYESFRNLLTWSVVPSVDAFRDAIEDAFVAWTEVDSATGLGTPLSFAPDLSIPVQGVTGYPYVSPLGAEIDLLASADAVFWNAGDAFLVAQAFYLSDYSIGGKQSVRLTSGVEDFPSAAIVAVDIVFNSNPQALWDLDSFRLMLTHEIGHALGLADVDFLGGPYFLDDGYDVSSSQSAADTLMNAWADQIDPFNPPQSPGLGVFAVADGDPGLDSAGVDLLMERCQTGSVGAGTCSVAGPLLGDLFPLSNDEFAGRQYLYPVPEPDSGMGALAIFAIVAARYSRDRYVVSSRACS